MQDRPGPSEAASYYFRYIDRVPDGDVRAFLESQRRAAADLFSSISEEESLHRYEPGKWSIRGVVSHVTDTERVFVSRAFWFARGFDTPLPSYDQDISAAAAHADEVSWRRHAEEFDAVRRSVLPFFQNLSADAWDRRGIASQNPVTVRALAWIIAGHADHHLGILRERYLGQIR
jgi:uncharacterized damage-inducible protein DinB